jgi:hypothetical protein
MSDREFLIPPRFFKSLTDEEAAQVVTTSRLTPELCARLWRMLDRQDEPPTSMTLYANSADIMRLWPAPSPNASAPAAAGHRGRAKRWP